MDSPFTQKRTNSVLVELCREIDRLIESFQAGVAEETINAQLQSLRDSMEKEIKRVSSRAMGTSEETNLSPALHEALVHIERAALDPTFQSFVEAMDDAKVSLQYYRGH